MDFVTFSINAVIKIFIFNFSREYGKTNSIVEMTEETVNFFIFLSVN